MNLRFEILRTVAASPGAPISEIADAMSHDRQKTAWAVRDCAKDGLLSKRLDDVTRQPGYTLTDAGKKRLEEGPASKQGRNQHAGAIPKAAPPEAEEFSLLGVIADIRAAIGDTTGKIMLGDLAQGIGEMAKLGDAHRRDVLAWEREMDRAIGADTPGAVAERISALREELTKERHAAQTSAAEVIGLKEDAAILQEQVRAVLAELGAISAAIISDDYLDPPDGGSPSLAEQVLRMRADIERMQREQMRGATCLSGRDRYTAAGYLVRAPKRRPRIITNQETAVELAMAAARGTGRSDVYALVHVGTARRDAVYRENQQ